MTSTIGERLVDIFQPSPNGQYVLNIPALTTLITWAEGDEALAARFGTWDQGVWARALFQHRGLDWEEAVHEFDARTSEEVKEATRNGVCETAYCMAGQAVTQAGYRLVFTHAETGDGETTMSTDSCVKQEFTGRFDDKGHPVMRDLGEEVPISVAAREILGLDGREAAFFFDSENEIDDLKHMVNAFAVRRGMEPLYPGVRSDKAEGYCETLENIPPGT